MLHSVIMAGGSGTRFWPASRSLRPKQLLDLSGDGTMLQATVARLNGLLPSENVLVVTNQKLVSAIRQQLPQVLPEQILGEPCKRDTAPCIGLAAAWISRCDPDATMLVMPSDHIIQNVVAFQSAVRSAKSLLDDNPDRLITFGIRPTYAAESFGYIERDDPISAEDVSAFGVKRFREKPKAELAQQFLDSGNFYWNSGIFVWRANTILNQLREREPDMFQHIANIGESIGNPNFEQVFQQEFGKIVGQSIDFAVMEQAEEVITIEAPFDWDDVGSWKALERLRDRDNFGNTIFGNHLGIDTENTIVRSDDGHLIVTLGLKNCLVVHTPDATLVADKQKEESVREVVKLLEEKGLTDYL